MVRVIDPIHNAGDLVRQEFSLGFRDISRDIGPRKASCPIDVGPWEKRNVLATGGNEEK